MVAYGRWPHVEVLLYSLCHLHPPSFLPQLFCHPPSPTKKCGMICLTPKWQKLLFFHCFSNSWPLMSHCYNAKFLLNRPISLYQIQIWQQGLREYINVKQKKSSLGPSEMNNTFLSLFSSKPWSQVCTKVKLIQKLININKK